MPAAALCNPTAITPFRIPELPNLGQSYSSHLSPHQERELGRAIMRELRQRLPLIEDPEINDYIQALGNRLVNQAPGSTQNFTFFVINDSSINAFAAPGGHIGLNSALILETESESELAGVIAHEISHITQAHFARRLEDIDRMTLPRAAAFIAGLALAAIDPHLGMATLMTSSAFAADHQLLLSRMNEREADRIGLGILYRSGFDPAGMSSFFRKLQRASLFNRKPIDFLSTHPLTEERLADMENRIRQFPSAEVSENQEYALTFQRLAVFMEKHPKTGVIQARKLLNESPLHPPVRYRHALALLQNKEARLARDEFKWLIAEDGDRLTYLIGLETAFFALNDINEAKKIYSYANRLYPYNASLIENHANLLINAGLHEDAFMLLRPYLMIHPGSTRMYKLAAGAAMSTQRTADGYRYLAEHYFERAAYPLALESLDNALRHSRHSAVEAESHLARKQEITRYLEKRLAQESH